jgi:hypothetical protein
LYLRDKTTKRSNPPSHLKKKKKKKKKKKRGLKRKLTEEDRDRIYDTVTHEDPHIRHRYLLAAVDTKIKVSSLRLLLREMGKYKWLQKRRPMLTKEHAKQRLEWALLPSTMDIDMVALSPMDG